VPAMRGHGAFAPCTLLGQITSLLTSLRGVQAKRSLARSVWVTTVPKGTDNSGLTRCFALSHNDCGGEVFSSPYWSEHESYLTS